MSKTIAFQIREQPQPIHLPDTALLVTNIFNYDSLKGRGFRLVGRVNGIARQEPEELDFEEYMRECARAAGPRLLIQQSILGECEEDFKGVEIVQTGADLFLVKQEGDDSFAKTGDWLISAETGCIVIGVRPADSKKSKDATCP